MQGVKMLSDLLKIFNKFGDLLLVWVNDFDQALSELSKKIAVAELDTSFITRKVQKEINQFYDLLQDTVDDVYEIMINNGLSEITPIWEKEILKGLLPRFEKYQKDSKGLYQKYTLVFDQLPEELADEIKIICFEFEAKDVLRLAKEYLSGRRD
jgi:hypothetical protein